MSVTGCYLQLPSCHLWVFTWQILLYMKWEKLLKSKGEQYISQNDNGKYLKYQNTFFIKYEFFIWVCTAE